MDGKVYTEKVKNPRAGANIFSALTFSWVPGEKKNWPLAINPARRDKNKEEEIALNLINSTNIWLVLDSVTQKFSDIKKGDKIKLFLSSNFATFYSNSFF